MPNLNLHVVRTVVENSFTGLHGTVTMPDGRVWTLQGRRIAEASPDAEPIERAMTPDDVDQLLVLGAIDRPTALRQIMRVLR